MANKNDDSHASQPSGASSGPSESANQKLGDRGQFWAEAGSPIVLPNSKIRVFFATGYHDWEHGCGWNDVSRCFWLNVPYDVPAGDLAPKQPVAWKFADYRAGRDTVLSTLPN